MYDDGRYRIGVVLMADPTSDAHGVRCRLNGHALSEPEFKSLKAYTHSRQGRDVLVLDVKAADRILSARTMETS